MMPINLEAVGLKVNAIAEPILRAQGLELVELKIVPLRGETRLEFIADRPTGGITIEQCAEANHALVEAITADGVLGEDFSLEFSSPGLDRPLTRVNDFKRNLNQPLRVLLHEAVEGKKEWTGTLKGVGDADILLVTAKKKDVTINLSQIIKAVLVI